MAVRTLEQIMKQLAPTYNPQVKNLRAEQAQLKNRTKADIQELEGAQKNAFDNIMLGARRRGLGFSGIPLGEQADYTSDVFLPSLSRLKQRQRDDRLTLEDAILGVRERQGQEARQIYQQELDREEARRASAASSWGGPSLDFGGGGNTGGGNTPTQGEYGFKQRGNKGFNFIDPDKKATSAATYSLATGTPFRELLQRMANDGDTGAQVALNFVGDDYGANVDYLRRVAKNNFQAAKQMIDVYNSLIWDSNRPQLGYNILDSRLPDTGGYRNTYSQNWSGA